MFPKTGVTHVHPSTALVAKGVIRRKIAISHP